MRIRRLLTTVYSDLYPRITDFHVILYDVFLDVCVVYEKFSYFLVTLIIFNFFFFRIYFVKKFFLMIYS